MESFWLEIDSTLKVRDGKASDDDESRICVEMNRDRDLKYSLPPNFYDDILTKLPDPCSISLDSWRYFVSPVLYQIESHYKPIFIFYIMIIKFVAAFYS